MSIQFILGRSGTGKTAQCVRAIARALREDAAHHLIFLVPEQATFQVERAILAQPGIQGFDQLAILSFERLQYQLLGCNALKQRLSAISRQMALHRILCEQEANLSVYRSSCANPGFCAQVMRIIEQLLRYANGPDDLARCIEQLEVRNTGALTAAKLRDIQILLEAYMQFVEGRFLDPDVQFNDARGAVHDSPLLKDARLWVDGFAGFTASEFLMLRAMLETVAEARIALCLDPGQVLGHETPTEIDPLDLFAPTLATFKDLHELVRDLKLSEEKPLVLTDTHRFSRSRALAHLEGNLFVPGAPAQSSDRSVSCWSATDERHEVKMIARQIRRMVADQGLRYRDIAVIASDLGRYEHYIQAYFSDYDLPFFIDKPSPLVHHACATLICSALHIAQTGFETSEVLTYLRSGLVSLDNKEIDALENYCLAFGINGRDWTREEAWAFDSPTAPAFAEAQVNSTRLRVIGPLLDLRSRFFDGNSPVQVTGQVFVQAIKTLLERLQVSQRLEALGREADRCGEPERADVHRQFWDWLCGLLAECSEILGSYQGTGDFFSTILRSAFAQMTMALIPPCLDQVLVGSIERSRHPDLKAVFLLGTTQKQFPAPLKSGGLLSDADRDHAALAGLCLAEGVVQTLSQRRYLAYIAFTRPSERLIVTHPLVDEKGNSVVRSQFIGDLEKLFDDLRADPSGSEINDPQEILCQHELADYLCEHVGTEGLLTELDVRDPFDGFQHALQSRGRGHGNRSLTPDVLNELFGARIKTSASKLGSFATCPFQYFARYTLGLKERQEFVLEPLDLGNFYHRVLECFVETMIREPGDWTALEGADLLLGLDRVMERVIQADPFLAAFVRHSPINAFVVHAAQEVLRAAVPEYCAMIRAGQFRPAYTEAAFGTGNRELGDFEIELSERHTVILQGIVDRIDLMQQGDRAYALVLDYKRRHKRPDWTRLFYGVDLQLGIYMLALRSARAQGLIDAQIAGAFFIPVEVPAAKAALSDPPARLTRFKRKAGGLFDAAITEHIDPIEKGQSPFYNFFKKTDGTPLGHYTKSGALESRRFELLLHFVSDKIKELSRGILDGDIAVRPCRLGAYVPCVNCPYKPLCRFDLQIDDVNYLDAKSKTEVLEALEQRYGK